MLQGQGTHVAIAFEVPGGWQKEKDAIVLTVLQVHILCLSVIEIPCFGFFVLTFVAQKSMYKMIEWN